MTIKQDMFPVDAETAPKQLARILKVGLVPIILAAPGVGKSSVTHQLGESNNLKLIDVRLSQVDSPELNGYPDVKSDIARYIPFDIFPTENTPLPVDANGNQMSGWLLFLDEATSAPRHVLAAAYKLVLDRKVGQHTLHPRCKIILAGNRKEDRAIVNEMGSAMQSRLVHLHMQSNAKVWSNWAVRSNIDSRVIGYLAFQPTALNQFNPDLVGGTFPCERTWEFLSKIIKGIPDSDLNDYMPAIGGAVGPGAAVEFMNFVKVFQNLPSMASILADPLNATVPTDIGTRFAMAIHIAEKIDKNNADKLAVYLARLQPEAQVVSVRMIKHRDPELLKTPALGKIFIAITKYL